MKKLLGSMAVVAALSSSVMAAPAISATEAGDFLIAPAFFANGGYQTDLRVINTSLTKSVLMRVVVRDAYCSKEVDFDILLSPSDIWDGTIKQGTNGTYISSPSDEDSNYLPQLQQGDGLNLTAANTKAEGKYTAGYVEFYPIAEFEEGAAVKVPKTVLEARYAALSGGDVDGVAGVAAPYNTKKAAPVTDIVTGFVTLKNNEKNLAMTLPMTAIAGSADEVNSGNDMLIGQDTIWTNYFGAANAVAVSNLFQTSEVVLPFIDGENQALFTFVNDGFCTTAQSRGFKINIRDTKENQPKVPSPEPVFTIPNELSSLAPASLLNAYQISAVDLANFQKGWIRMNGLTNQHAGQAGKGTNPYVIPTQMKAITTDKGVATNWTYLPSF